MSALHNTRWSKLRVAILRRDSYRCHWCGARATEADHVKARAEGGQVYDPANLVAACKPCNASRGAQLGNSLRKSPGIRPSRRTTVSGAIRA